MSITSKAETPTGEELDTISKRVVIDKNTKTVVLTGFSEPITLLNNTNINKAKTYKYLTLAFFLDQVIQKFQQLVGQGNITFRSRADINLTTRLSLFHTDKKYTDLLESKREQARYKGVYPSRESLYDARETTTYLSIEYDEDANFWAFIPSQEQSQHIFALLQKSIQVKTPSNHREVIYALDSFRRGLDGLFIQEGFEPTSQNRSNVLSLVLSFSGKLKKDENIQKLIRPENCLDPLSDRKLIHAAANGYHASIIKMFYLYGYYPSSIEEMKMFAAMPYDMLANVLGSK